MKHLILAFLLVACGGADKSNETTTDPGGTEDTTDDTTDSDTDSGTSTDTGDTDTETTEAPVNEFGCAVGGNLGDPDLEGFVPSVVPSHVTLVDLGVVFTECGFSEPLFFEVPEGQYAAQLVLVGHEGSVVFPTHIRSPGGNDLVVFDAVIPKGPDANYGQFGSLQAQGLNPEKATNSRSNTLIPNNDGVTLEAGTYEAVVGSWGGDPEAAWAAGLDSAVHAFLYLTPEDPQVGEQQLDLALHFSGSNGLDAALAQKFYGVTDALAAVDATLSQVGVRVGEVSFHDMPSGFDGPLELTTDNLDDVQNTNASGPEHSLNIFFVSNFEVPGYPGVGDTIIGLSIGLPGVPFARRSGVLMATERLAEDPSLASHVMAHEIGHFLGLFHTEEQFGDRWDPLADTPEGPSDNLMFFSVEDKIQPVLTGEQGRVIRRHGLVRPAP